MTRTLASMVGPSGSVTGVDLHAAQLEEAKILCAQQGLTNTCFIEADACGTGLPRRLGPIRGVDYSIANRLFDLVAEAGFFGIGTKVYQPAERLGSIGLLLKWSVEEAGTAFVESGLITPDELTQTLLEMQSAAADPGVLALSPRMSLVWGRKNLA